MASHQWTHSSTNGQSQSSTMREAGHLGYGIAGYHPQSFPHLERLWAATDVLYDVSQLQ